MPAASIQTPVLASTVSASLVAASVPPITGIDQTVHMITWVGLNLVPPLVAVPIVLYVLYVFNLLPSKNWKLGLFELLGDGQLCFYAIAVLSASFFELFDSTKNVKGLMLLHTMLLLLCFGFFVLAVCVDRIKRINATRQTPIYTLPFNIESYGITMISMALSVVAVLIASGTHFYLKYF